MLSTSAFAPLFFFAKHLPLLMQQQTVLMCLSIFGHGKPYWYIHGKKKIFVIRKLNKWRDLFLFFPPFLPHLPCISMVFMQGINTACGLRQIHPALCLPLLDCRTWFAMLAASWQTSFQDGNTMIKKNRAKHVWWQHCHIPTLKQKWAG